MPEETQRHDAARVLRLGVWVLFVAAFAFLYYRYSALWGTEITRARRVVGVARVRHLRRCSGALRGFALIPVTNLVVLAIPIFPPVPLLVLTLSASRSPRRASTRSRDR